VRGKRVEKAVRVAVEKGVKVHIFKPSNREIWSVVGKDREYWVDPEDNFCSCEDYYFKTLSGKERCYHLQIIDIAKEKKLVDVIEFNDDEYESFLKALINDMFLSIRKES
jgi:predicted nucleic acid-binding Zn finger protein